MAKWSAKRDNRGYVIAMTMNKSQGQSPERAGLFLPRPVFSHGQLYVAFSRSGDPPSAAKGVRVVAVGVEGAQGNLKGPDGGVFTRNVVHREVLAARGPSTEGEGGKGRAACLSVGIAPGSYPTSRATKKTNKRIKILDSQP